MFLKVILLNLVGVEVLLLANKIIEMKEVKKQYKIGLALGGGGARGFAHLGVLKALKEKGVTPDVISGVSAGAIAGAFIASGMDPGEVFDLLKDQKIFDISRIHFPRDGFLYLSGLKKQLKRTIRYQNLEDLPMPLIVAATNLNSGRVEYFSKGPLADIILASSSIPIVFSPVDLNGSRYVDGGLIDNLPIRPLQGKVQTLIGVNISPLHEEEEVGNMIQVAKRVFNIGVHSASMFVGKKCDILIEPSGVHEYDVLQSKKAEEIFNLGYRFTKSMEFEIPA